MYMDTFYIHFWITNLMLRLTLALVSQDGGVLLEQEVGPDWVESRLYIVGVAASVAGWWSCTCSNLSYTAR